MDPTMLKLRTHLDSLISYITPLLPLANCHMVEFLTHSHWETLLPMELRESLDAMGMDEAVDKFWSFQSGVCDNSPLSLWVKAARTHCLSVNDDYCLSVPQLEQRIRARGGDLPPEIPVTAFMNPKKSYEVRVMSRILSSLYHISNASCSLEAGGGLGHLLVSASRGYGLRSLTVDAAGTTLAAAEQRSVRLQKQWHAIAKTGKNDRNSQTENLHRFAQLFITEHTDLAGVVKEKFPEVGEDVKILLTGLHTCGNLGPNSLRIFASQPSTCAVFNVPCCYHLLTEATDEKLFDVFQRDYGGEETREGFPMSEHLRGWSLGRNARMLGAQAAERAAAARAPPPRSLLHRALLQVIIKKHKPDFAVANGRLKRIAAKTQDFEQYFKMADSILNLELYGKVPTSYLTDIDCQWKKMVLFYLIRLCLAQVVESLILLDRLLFLKENGFSDVYLVKLFDPVLSPRCHSIVAIR